MYISAGWRDIELSLFLSEEKPNLHVLQKLCLFFFKTLKKYLASKYLEPALNHKMVRVVLTEPQTSDCDIKCRITFITKGIYCRRMLNSKQQVDPNFYQFDQ